MTRNQPQRFENLSDAEIGAKVNQPAVEALQDIASQLAKLMGILEMEKLSLIYSFEGAGDDIVIPVGIPTVSAGLVALGSPPGQTITLASS